jgi:hypothetical protein
MNSPQSRSARFVSAFNLSAGLLLVAMGMLHLLGNRGSGLMQPPDPIFAISSRYLFWMLGVLKILLAAVCLGAKSPGTPPLWVAWLATNLLVYRVALVWFGTCDVKAYYVTMANAFGISPRTVDVLVTLGVGYLLAGSYMALVWMWWSRKQALPPGDCPPN